MFAVIRTGGKQYKVAANDVVKIEKLEAEAGETVSFDEVLMIGEGDRTTVGTPTIAGAAVTGSVLEQTRGEKVIAFKKRRRKHSSKRKKGHRQYLTVVRIGEIISSGAKPREAAAAPASKPAKADADAAESHRSGSGPVASSTPAAPRKPANLLSEPEGAPENLTVLPGVDADTQFALYDAGVFHVWQMENWSDAEWAWLEQRIGRKIDRTTWITIIRKTVTTRRRVVLPGRLPGNLLQTPNGHREDLTVLPGVNAAAQEQLYDLGVFHISQIAEWDADEIAHVKARLALHKAPIEGDDWIIAAAAER